MPAYDLGALHVTGAPPLDPAIAAELAPFARVASQRLLDLSAAGDAALILVNGQVVEARLGAPPVLRAARDVWWAAFGPGAEPLVLADRAGDEEAHLERAGVRLDARPTRQVDPVWTRGQLAWAEVAPDGTDTELWLGDGRGAGRRVFAGAGAWSPQDLSRDGTQLLARHVESSARSALYRIDVATGAAVALTPVAPDAATPRGRFGPAGELLALTTAGGRDRTALVALGPAGARVLAAVADADVADLALLPRGGLAYVVDDERGESRLYVGDALAAGAPTGGVISDLHAALAGDANADVLAFTATDPQHPKRAVRYDVAARLAEAFAPVESPIDPDAFVAPASASTRAADGTTVALLVYTPPLSVAPAPVVLAFHGGPEDRVTPRYDGFVQFLVHRGFAVVLPDVRGSTGHGRAFAALDDGPRRADVLLDVAATLAWIRARPELDPHRVAALGTSYGGWLALAAATAFPTELRAAIALSGIASLPAFLATTRADRRAHRRAEYGDERDPAVASSLAALSPAPRIPLLVAYGAHDPRVPPAATVALVAAARRAGTPVWALVAADDGHAFSQAGNRGAFEVAVAAFLARHVL